MISQEELDLAQDKIELGRRCQALESDLATLRAEAVRLREALENLCQADDTLDFDRALANGIEVLSSTPATEQVAKVKHSVLFKKYWANV